MTCASIGVALPRAAGFTLYLCVGLGLGLADAAPFIQPTVQPYDYADYMPGFNLRFDRIQGAAAGLKIVVGPRSDFDGGGTNVVGAAAEVEVGEHGGHALLGYGSGSWALEGMYTDGYLLGVSVLRTWDDPEFAEANQTYIGIGGEFSLFWVQISGGVYRHMHGNDEDHDWLGTLGIGLGF
jgi:hypothetical protein